MEDGMKKPRVGGRAEYTGQAGCRIEHGTIVEVSPDGKIYQVRWDNPDEYDNDITEHEWDPASGVRPV